MPSSPEYLQKFDQPVFTELFWNFPEQKTGQISVIGGHSQHFASIVKISEQLKQFPFKTIQTVLPDSLKNHLPPLPNFHFTPSTDSGSFANSKELIKIAQNTDFAFFAGHFSKNSATTLAIIDSIVARTDKPTFLVGDTVDLITGDAETITTQPLIMLATTVQLQKLFRALYYPKMLLLSMPLLTVAEVLHKFTLSYPLTIITFTNEHLLVAHHGKIAVTDIKNTPYTPLSLWQGQLACQIVAANFWNPNNTFKATTAALFKTN